jgi:F-type H+-transporting ATPase subunit b
MEGGILGILGKVGFDWQVALVNLVNFIIIFLLLRYFAFKPISRVIEERQAKIKKGLDDAQLAETNLMKAEDIAKTITDGAKIQANDIVAAAQSRAEGVLFKAEEDGREHAQGIINEAHKINEKERSKMEREIRGQAATLIVDSVRKILEENITEKEHEKITMRALEMMRN